MARLSLEHPPRRIVQEVLKQMKKERKICDFVKTAKLSRVNVMGGVDFYVIIIRGDRRRILRLCLSGLDVNTKQHKGIRLAVRGWLEEIIQNFTPPSPTD